MKQKKKQTQQHFFVFFLSTYNYDYFHQKKKPEHHKSQKQTNKQKIFIVIKYRYNQWKLRWSSLFLCTLYCMVVSPLETEAVSTVFSSSTSPPPIVRTVLSVAFLLKSKSIFLEFKSFPLYVIHIGQSLFNICICFGVLMDSAKRPGKISSDVSSLKTKDKNAYYYNHTHTHTHTSIYRC